MLDFFNFNFYFLRFFFNFLPAGTSKKFWATIGGNNRNFFWGKITNVVFFGGGRLSVSRQKLIMRIVWTDTKDYVNRCEPAQYFMLTSVNREHIFCACHLQIFVNWCEPVENIMWTGVNRRVKLCEPMRTVVRTNWKSVWGWGTCPL